MHLVEQRFTSRAALSVSALFVAVLVGLTAADVASRHTFPVRPPPPAIEACYRR